MIIFYSKKCEGCSGNHALARMKFFCEKKGIDFQERRTIFWQRWEQEAEEIMRAKQVSLPFFFSTESQQVIQGNSLTPISEIEKLIRLEKKP